MKQVSTLFDALRNEKFAIAVKDDYGVKYYGSEGQSAEWTQWANSLNTKSLETIQLPAGVIQGPYKNISDSSLKSLLTAFGNNIEEIKDSFHTSKGYAFKNSYRVDNGARVPAVMDTPIGHFATWQYEKAINYKGLAFRSQIKQSSFLFEARANNYAFNFENYMYNSAPSRSEIKSLRHRIDTNLGRSHERRLGIKLKTVLTENSGRYRIGPSYELETKSIDEDLNVKGIGQRIGGAGRLGRRAMRVANFDPKAWDGDGDKIVQEGTPYERPAIPGVNDRATGGKVNVRAAVRAWENQSGRPQSPKPPKDFRPIDGNLGGKRPGQLPEVDVSQYLPIPSVSKRNSKPITGGMRSRIGSAQMDRQATGLASRSAKAKKKSKLKATPGRDRVDEKDGSLWSSLTPEQQEQVRKNAEESYERLQRRAIKDDPYLGTWWSSFLGLDRKKNAVDADGNPWSDDSRIAGEAITSFEIAIETALSRAQSELDSVVQSMNKMAPDSPERKKLERKAKSLSRSIEKIQKTFDDLRTYDQMKKTGDWSLLEHLHPEERKKAFGLGLSKDEKETIKSPFEGGKLPRGMKVDEPSTIFEEIGGVKRDKPKLIGEKGDKKLKELADRVLRPNPERARRRALRKRGKSGRATTDRDKSADDSSDTRKRIRRAVNEFKLKVKGKRDIGKINQEAGKKVVDNEHAFKRSDGVIEITGRTVAVLAEMSGDFKITKKKRKEGQAVVTSLGARRGLVGLWNGNKYNAVPTWIRKDEVEQAIADGWVPIKRGFGGHPEHADDWLTSPDRFVPGQGGAVVGAGEYWSHPNGGWDNYVQGDGILGFVRRDRLATADAARRMKENHSRISRVVDSYTSGEGSGGRWDTELTAPELAEEIKKKLSEMLPDDDKVWETEWGQVYRGMIDWMLTVDPSDKKSTSQAVEALKFLSKMSDADTTMHAGFLGYDGIDFGQGDGRVVMHNRTAMLALLDIMPVEEIKKIVGEAA